MSSAVEDVLFMRGSLPSGRLAVKYLGMLLTSAQKADSISINDNVGQFAAA
jgi:hypothetical protein